MSHFFRKKAQLHHKNSQYIVLYSFTPNYQHTISYANCIREINFFQGKKVIEITTDTGINNEPSSLKSIRLINRKSFLVTQIILNMNNVSII